MNKYNCNKIKDASKKVTNDIFIRYKTPILDGAIKLINEFKKDNDDGVHYKKLCEELLKYVKVQKRCLREEVSKEGKSLTAREWNKIVNALYITLNSQKIKSLCYLEKDNEETKKKEVLNIHEVFRDFCIEKKVRLQNISDMNFEQCNEYMSWLNGKKMHLKSIDPNYEYIEEYQEYFNIHNNCNYPWLVSNTLDVTCSQITRTRGKEKGARKSLGDSSQTASPVLPDSTADSKKDIPLSSPTFSQNAVPTSDKSTRTGPEKAPAKITPSPDTINSGSSSESRRNDVFLSGTPVMEYHPVSQHSTVFKPTLDYNDPDVKTFLYSLRTNLDGQKITHDIHDEFKRKPVNISNQFRTHIEGKPIKSSISESYKLIPRKLLYKEIFLPHVLSKQRFDPPTPRSQQIPASILYSQRFPKTFPYAVNYLPKHKFMKSQEPFSRNLSPFPVITSGTIKNYY
ncbi:hypothetical protein POVCU2_0082710 [Plasmodium ovale curtisi]|uniref:STP1 protein n=1 Tax=Plasmodium ovale curtisi TaxID=864141 RepID=A0A1A8WN23_PLAOA|nr:hypothetical protein POVCU2_0082710 [Plasmodium ovale curtisi]